jgi:hypothetical protein
MSEYNVEHHNWVAGVCCEDGEAPAWGAACAGISFARM